MDASTFPIPFPFHLIFCIIAGLFFLFQFIRLKRSYQLILAVTIPASLLIYVGDAANKTWFHTVGAFELIMLIGAIVLAVMDRARQRKIEKAKEVQEMSAETDTSAADAGENV